ncbi:hypothetical protein VNO77_44473 [Canavalia gladiata]|uniref:Secreted protein n=1 Tax=Canavalia gladiata TaxID=3824 RepID=A0AAN9JYK0_CANGL
MAISGRFWWLLRAQRQTALIVLFLCSFSEDFAVPNTFLSCCPPSCPSLHWSQQPMKWPIFAKTSSYSSAFRNGEFGTLKGSPFLLRNQNKCMILFFSLQ